MFFEDWLLWLSLGYKERLNWSKTNKFFVRFFIILFFSKSLHYVFTRLCQIWFQRPVSAKKYYFSFSLSHFLNSLNFQNGNTQDICSLLFVKTNFCWVVSYKHNKSCHVLKILFILLLYLNNFLLGIYSFIHVINFSQIILYSLNRIMFVLLTTF